MRWRRDVSVAAAAAELRQEEHDTAVVGLKDEKLLSTGEF